MPSIANAGMRLLCRQNEWNIRILPILIWRYGQHSAGSQGRSVTFPWWPLWCSNLKCNAHICGLSFVKCILGQPLSSLPSSFFIIIHGIRNARATTSSCVKWVNFAQLSELLNIFHSGSRWCIMFLLRDEEFLCAWRANEIRYFVFVKVQFFRILFRAARRQ